MDNNHKRLAPEEREAIHRYLGKGLGQNEIARMLGRDKGVVSRELKPFRATGKPYSPHPCPAERGALAPRQEEA